MWASKRWWLGGVVMAAGVVALTTPWSPRLEAAPTPKALPPVPVRVALAEQQNVPQELQVVGHVQSLHQVVVRPQIEGMLTEVRFAEGQRVSKGQVLARLDDRSLKAQLAQAEAELARLHAQLQLARSDLTRYEGLAAKSAVPIQQRDQQAAVVAQLQSQIHAQEAALTAARVQLSYTVITSPVEGRVGLRNVDAGNFVRPSDADGLVTVVQTQPMAIVFSAPQTRLADVRAALNTKGGATVRVADQERGIELAQGRLLTADNRVDAGSGSLRLKAQVPNTSESLWPGQFVAVTLVTGQIPQALVVPATAVQRGLRGSFVWRVSKQGKAEMVPVTVRWQNDERAVLALDDKGSSAKPGGTVGPGDQIVIDGQSRLKPATAVRVLDAGKA